MNDGGPPGRWLCAAILHGLLEVKAKGFASCTGEGQRRSGEPLWRPLAVIVAISPLSLPPAPPPVSPPPFLFWCWLCTQGIQLVEYPLAWSS